ncbi:MAG: hypothetical protein R2838_03395 [Caldilineaceae bacterium]
MANPTRRPGMLDGSDAIADWPILNALIQPCVQRHGRACTTAAAWASATASAGQVIVADGTPRRPRAWNEVLTVDPGMGIARHVGAGYRAVEVARERGRRDPVLSRTGPCLRSTASRYMSTTWSQSPAVKGSPWTRPPCPPWSAACGSGAIGRRRRIYATASPQASAASKIAH